MKDRSVFSFCMDRTGHSTTRVPPAAASNLSTKCMEAGDPVAPPVTYRWKPAQFQRNARSSRILFLLHGLLFAAALGAVARLKDRSGFSLCTEYETYSNVFSGYETYSNVFSGSGQPAPAPPPGGNAANPFRQHPLHSLPIRNLLNFSEMHGVGDPAAPLYGNLFNFNEMHGGGPEMKDLAKPCCSRASKRRSKVDPNQAALPPTTRSGWATSSVRHRA